MNQPTVASSDTGIQKGAPSSSPPSDEDQARGGITAAPPGLGLWDVVSIIVGIVVGTGIYETPPLVFSQVSGAAEALAVWAVCGLLALIGALCYAELASGYPRTGGDYVYLSRAFGRWVGFLFGWAQLAVILTGSIGMMAYVFADYAVKLGVIQQGRGVFAALLVVFVLTLLNVLGLVFGKWTQNFLSAAKVLSLGGILVAGLCWPAPHTGATILPAQGTSSLAFALVLVFLTYGGWNDAAFVAAEIRDRRRNIPRALLLGTGLVTLLYLLVNAAYLWGLGFDGARQSKAIAADVLAQTPLGTYGTQTMCLLVMISALGAVNGLILSGARVLSALGTDYALFAWLGRWSARRGAPVGALMAQAGISLAMIAVVAILPKAATTDDPSLAVNTWSLAAQAQYGQSLAAGPVPYLLGAAASATLAPPTAELGRSGFETLLKCTAPAFWLFFLLTSLSLFVLRWRDPDTPRPFQVPFYPYLPLVFCATCSYMLYAAIDYAGLLGLVGGGLLLAGLPLLAISQLLKPSVGR